MAGCPTALIDTYRGLSCSKEVCLFVSCQQLQPRLPMLVARQRCLPFSMLHICCDARWFNLKFLHQQRVPMLKLAIHTSNVSPVYSLSTIAYTLYTKQDGEFIEWVISHMIMIMMIGREKPNLALFSNKITWDMILYVMTSTKLLSMKANNMVLDVTFLWK